MAIFIFFCTFFNIFISLFITKLIESKSFQLQAQLYPPSAMITHDKTKQPKHQTRNITKHHSDDKGNKNIKDRIKVTYKKQNSESLKTFSKPHEFLVNIFQSGEFGFYEKQHLVQKSARADISSQNQANLGLFHSFYFFKFSAQKVLTYAF